MFYFPFFCDKGFKLRIFSYAATAGKKNDNNFRIGLCEDFIHNEGPLSG